MRKISDQEKLQIAVDVVGEFHCFGEGAENGPSGILANVIKTEEPCFALGVPVRAVVDYVLSRIEGS